jgi:hypothetical protein
MHKCYRGLFQNFEDSYYEMDDHTKSHDLDPGAAIMTNLSWDFFSNSRKILGHQLKIGHAHFFPYLSPSFKNHHNTRPNITYSVEKAFFERHKKQQISERDIVTSELLYCNE